MINSLLDIIPKSQQFPLLPEFARSGIYFLYRDGVVVYVGQAANMRVRIGNHLSESQKTFDAVSCFPCEPRHMNAMERLFICCLVPTYNRCGLSEQMRMFKAANCSGQEMLSLATVPDDSISRSMAGLILGLSDEQLKAVDRQALPYSSRRITRARVIARRYRLLDVVNYRISLSNSARSRHP